MKLWQIIVLLLLLAGAAYLVITHPPTRFGMGTDRNDGLPSSSDSLNLLFVGDVMLSRSVGQLMAAKNDWTWPFERIASVTAAADLTFGNLETTISTRGATHGCTYCFRADPRAVQGLILAGFDVMSVANNHIWDYGPDAFGDTLLALSTSDISYVGGGRDIMEARGGVIRTVRGVRVGYLAYTDLLPSSVQAGPSSPGVNTFDADRMRQDITAMRPRADVIIVSFHTGDEYQTTHNAKQQEIYHAAIDAGADMVIGHHPHVVQEVEHYREGWIAYSLGNFVFDQSFSSETTAGLMLRVTVQRGRVAGVQHLPISISKEYQPFLAP